jgi:spore maturation protein A
MLNHLWLGLIVLGILAAVANDVRDEVTDPYRNGRELTAILEVQRSPSPLRNSWEGDLVLSGGDFGTFYGIPVKSAEIRQPASIAVSAGGGGVLTLQAGDALPEPWKTMAKGGSTRDRLTGVVRVLQPSEDRKEVLLRFTFEPIRFLKLRAVTQAALEYAATAVTIALGLIGVMALWLGVMKVGEEAGLLTSLTRLLTPLTRRLFPDVPANHPAIGAIIMNTAANMLGLSNAATPMGLKAMEELNKLNPKPGTATNAMVTFLAINTGGLILIPATAMAVRAASGSAAPGLIIGTSIIGAGVATVAGVIASKLLQRLPLYRRPLETSHE